MHRNKQIAIILSDTLRSIGLQSLLTDYFPPVEVCYFPNFEMLSSTGSDTYDYYFTDSDTLVLNADFFLPRRNKTALLIDSTEEHGALSSTNRITLRSSQETIIEQLQQLFTSDSSGNTTTENNILTHRKNITAKLGIKTVSGLTFYAIMNGIISGDDIEL